MPQDNLDKIRELVGILESQENKLDYVDTLYEIENIIREEKEIINNVKTKDTKLKHYETICASILSVISATKL